MTWNSPNKDEEQHTRYFIRLQIGWTQLGSPVSEIYRVYFDNEGAAVETIRLLLISQQLKDSRMTNDILRKLDLLLPKTDIYLMSIYRYIYVQLVSEHVDFEVMI